MDAYIVDGIRTPIGSFGGTLAAVRADDLAAMVIKELLKRNTSVPPQQSRRCNTWMCQSSWRR